MKRIAEFVLGSIGRLRSALKVDGANTAISLGWGVVGYQSKKSLNLLW